MIISQREKEKIKEFIKKILLFVAENEESTFRSFEYQEWEKDLILIRDKMFEKLFEIFRTTEEFKSIIEKQELTNTSTKIIIDLSTGSVSIGIFYVDETGTLHRLNRP